VRAGELWWDGKEQAFDVKVWKAVPPCLDIQGIVQSAFTPSGRYRDGASWNAKTLDDHEEILTLSTIWRTSVEAEIAATESSDRASNAIIGLRKTVQSFKGEIKNDLSSLKAASERVQSEVMQMGKAYKQAADLLITPEFKQAIENAERLALALKAIQDLSATKVSVAVFAGGKDANPAV